MLRLPQRFPTLIHESQIRNDRESPVEPDRHAAPHPPPLVNLLPLRSAILGRQGQHQPDRPFPFVLWSSQLSFVAIRLEIQVVGMGVRRKHRPVAQPVYATRLCAHFRLDALPVFAAASCLSRLATLPCPPATGRQSPVATFGRAQDFLRLSKWRFATFRVAQLTQNKNRNSEDRPPNCTAARVAALPENLPIYSSRIRRCNNKRLPFRSVPETREVRA